MSTNLQTITADDIHQMILARALLLDERYRTGLDLSDHHRKKTDAQNSVLWIAHNETIDELENNETYDADYLELAILEYENHLLRYKEKLLIKSIINNRLEIRRLKKGRRSNLSELKRIAPTRVAYRRWRNNRPFP